MDVNQVAALLRLSPTTVERYAKLGKIKAERVPDPRFYKWSFRKEDINSYLGDNLSATLKD